MFTRKETTKAVKAPKADQENPSTTPRYATNQKKTQITIKYDVGFPNQLTIRGNGANLSWDRGQPLKNIKRDEWVWETDVPFTHCEFKVLVNDRHYETGDNHHLTHGTSIVYTPHF